MTITEKVAYYSSDEFGESFKHLAKPFWWGFFDEMNGFEVLEKLILQGNKDLVENYLDFYKYKLKIVKEIVTLYKNHKGNKKTSHVTFIKIHEGVLIMNEKFIKDFLKWDRLVKHALVRVNKHPLNKKV